MTVTMKPAKEYYADVFEGIRLVTCGTFMLAVCCIKWANGKIRDLRRKNRREKIIDAEFEEVKANNE